MNLSKNILNYNQSMKISKNSLENLSWYLLFMQFVANNLARNSIIYDILAMLYIFVTLIYLYSNKAIRVNKYFLLMIAFILYNITLNLTGGAFDIAHSNRMIITITLNTILSIIMYSLFIYSKNTIKILNIFIYATFISVIGILIIYKDTLLTGRLAFSWRDSTDVSYNLFGIKLMTAQSNAIAYFTFIAFMLSTYIYIYIDKKKRYIIFNIIFIIVTLLTGSRKGILYYVMGSLYYILLSNNGIKKIRSIILFVSLILLVYYIVTINEKLYEILGYRMEQLISLALGKSFDDGSASTRMILIEQAHNYFIKNPVLGYGLDSFRVMGTGIVSDNNFYEIAVSSGIIGLIIYYIQIPMIFMKYVLTTNKMIIYKVINMVFILTLINSLVGSVIYYSRDVAFVNTLLFYIMYVQKQKVIINKGSTLV